MRKVVTIFAVVFAAAATMSAVAQRPGGRGGPGGGGPGGRGGPPPNPLFEALDADGDDEVSANEIENAVAALKKLDGNKDGKLTAAEVSPFGVRGRRGPGGPGRGGPRGGGPGGGGDVASFAERILSFDENKDGKVAKAELPERMQRVLDRLDANNDDSLDKTELEQAAAQFGQGRDRGGRGGPGGGFGRRGGRGRGFGGPPNPDRFVEHALTFDADKDGKLSQAELAKLAEEFVRRGGRGGRGGRPGGGDRPERPARPQ